MVGACNALPCASKTSTLGTRRLVCSVIFHQGHSIAVPQRLGVPQTNADVLWRRATCNAMSLLRCICRYRNAVSMLQSISMLYRCCAAFPSICMLCPCYTFVLERNNEGVRLFDSSDKKKYQRINCRSEMSALKQLFFQYWTTMVEKHHCIIFWCFILSSIMMLLVCAMLIGVFYFGASLMK